MNRIILLLLPLLAAAAPPNRLSPQEKKEGYILLFNGTDLQGWDGDPERWSVQDGAIVGCSDGKPFRLNTFLIYKSASFANFILRVDIKLRNFNSGIQFRSEQLPGPGWIVRGLQADASEVDDERSAWGNFYEERGRSRTMMKTPDEGWKIAKSVVRHGEWNSYQILADGDHFKLTLNGVVTIDQHAPAPAGGIIAFQLHAGQEMRVDFRNVKLKKLP